MGDRQLYCIHPLFHKKQIHMHSLKIFFLIIDPSYPILWCLTLSIMTPYGPINRLLCHYYESLTYKFCCYGKTLPRLLSLEFTRASNIALCGVHRALFLIAFCPFSNRGNRIIRFWSCWVVSNSIKIVRFLVSITPEVFSSSDILSKLDV